MPYIEDTIYLIGFSKFFWKLWEPDTIYYITRIFGFFAQLSKVKIPSQKKKKDMLNTDY